MRICVFILSTCICIINDSACILIHPSSVYWRLSRNNILKPIGSGGIFYPCVVATKVCDLSQGSVTTGWSWSQWFSDVERERGKKKIAGHSLETRGLRQFLKVTQKKKFQAVKVKIRSNPRLLRRLHPQIQNEIHNVELIHIRTRSSQGLKISDENCDQQSPSHQRHTWSHRDQCRGSVCCGQLHISGFPLI